MIVAMARVRILGPRDLLTPVLETLQDIGTLHLCAPDVGEALASHPLSPQQAREERHLRRALEHVQRALDLLRVTDTSLPRRGRPDVDAFARWTRLGWRVRRACERCDARETAALEERALIQKYQHFFAAFRALIESEHRWPNATAYHVLLRSSDAAVITRLRASLAAVVGDEFQLHSQPLPTGEIAVLIIISATAAARVERLLAEAHVQEIEVPEAYGGRSLSEAIPRMQARLEAIPGELDALRRERAELARTRGAELLRARAALHDRLAELRAIPLSGATPRAFVVEGWVPADGRRDLAAAIQTAFGDRVVVTEVAREAWASEDAPVVLRNPRLLRPFEAVIGLMPLPRYGTIDPTPFVAVFFPAFYGMILGDVGYGLVLAALALLLRAKARPGTMLHDIAEVAGACAVFGVIAGVLFGEFFGDLGRRWFGLHPLWFDRGEALMPFLALAVALGAVHILIGLVLGAIGNIRRHPRAALGRGLSALMIVLIAIALLATANVLPRGFFTPAVVGLLAAFPVLIVAEGLIAPIELLSTVGNILSYARIMALGVASVMLAVVANDMAGALGSVAVGVVFALLFHLVNFAIALFSPTIHALRLHYVEFFGKFYSPGGTRYQPFGHWTRAPAAQRG